MKRELRTAGVLFLLLTLLTGVVYPATVTLFGRLLFADQASGSVLERNGTAIGSALLGQSFSSAGYFWSRPSATAAQPYNGAASGGSNLGPTNVALMDAVRARVAALRAADPGNTRPVPVDLVTASASGLDPHISPAAADYQIARVARARGMTADELRPLVEGATEARTFGLLGEPRVNVVRLNLALDAVR
jgi:potassium-transporting ATPase KdpC subunit